MSRIGFIGYGNMGRAMIDGLLNNADRCFNPCDIVVCDVDMERLNNLKEEKGLYYTTDANKLARMSDIIVLAIKPFVLEGIISSIKESISSQVIVSIAAGKTLSSIEAVLGSSVKAVRVMPNTPALVGEGMSALCPNENVTEEEMSAVKTIFESFGKAEILSESLFNTFTAISGSSPAYVFMFIEAMADAAVLNGMPRELAYKFSAQAVLGSASMLLQTGKHPGELKDMVCSPAGTTIEAVAELERRGFRSAVIDAVNSCVLKADKMS